MLYNVLKINSLSNIQPMPPITPQQPNNKSQPVSQANQTTAPAGFGAGLSSLTPQPVQPNLPPQKSQLIPLIVLGLLVLVLGFASFYFFSKYSAATKANNTKYADGKKAGQDEQKASDDAQNLKNSQSDTRTYNAPRELGEFSFVTPKTFSIYSTTNTASGTPLVLLANPDRVESTSKFQALRVTVKNSLYSKEKESYDKLIKDKKISSSPAEDLKIRDWNATRYVGKFDSRDKPGTVILIEVRDKTFVFQTDNNEAKDLLDAFNTTINSIIIQ